MSNSKPIPGYNFKEIEKKWKEKWEVDKIYQPDLDKAKKPFYNLMMFPYPSAEGLHIGGVYTFTGVDTFGRFKKMQGYDVFEPIGLDGFGIHSENYAMKIGEHIKEVSRRTEKNFYRQLSSIGNMYDWSRTVETYKPEYYKWTQWLFLQLFKKGLAYQKKAKVNWCPWCKTVLSDEQVIQGVCERCDSQVEKKELKQWFFKITDYAERLLKNLEWIDWSEDVKINQKNWIGKSEGANINFLVKSQKSKVKSSLKVFTTRPDTLFGATYMVLAPEHQLIEKIKDKIENWEEAEKYINQAKAKSEQERKEDEKEKTGVEIKGIKAINPVNNEEIPIWIADYVLAGYGTGAIMAVPAHDERDYQFAIKYELPVIEVVKEVKSQKTKVKSCFAGEGVTVNSDFLDGLKTKEAKEKMIKWLEEKGIGKKSVDYKLRDWCVSRQRYWGPPIPIIWCEKCAQKQIKKEEIKLEINCYNQKTWKGLVSGKKTVETRALNPEEKNRYFGNIKESELFSCRNKETDEMVLFKVKKIRNYKNLEDFFEDKYYLKKASFDKVAKSLEELSENYAKYSKDYLERIEKNGLVAWEIEKIKTPVPVPEKDLPVELPEMEDFLPEGKGKGPLAKNEEFVKTKCPVCGGPAERETDVSDPFVDSAWYFLRYPSTEFENEAINKERSKKWLPVDSYIGGKEHTVLHLLYSRFITMVLKDLEYIEFEEPYKRFFGHGLITKDGAKMSKSKGNVINPDEMIEKYGVDTVRLYLRFLGDFSQGGDWRDDGAEGMARFVKKVWQTFYELEAQGQGVEKTQIIDKTIKTIGQDLERLSFNTAVARYMEFINWVRENSDKFNKDQVQKIKEILALVLAPLAPHIAEEFWAELGNEKSIFTEKWPEFDENNLEDDQFELVVQVNGKVRDRMKVSRNITQEEAEKKALESEKIVKNLNGQKPKKIIYIKEKLINIVI